MTGMLRPMTDPDFRGFETVHLDVPPRWLRLTGLIRGYWRRELLALTVAFAAGLALAVALLHR